MFLRPVGVADMPELFRIQLDPEANRMAALIPRDRAAFEAALERARHDAAVTLRAVIADGELVGLAACLIQDGRNSVGYWIAREHWGRGIATRAVGLLVREVATRPLYARVARHNAASLRVLEKCGFVVADHWQSPATERYLACERVLLVLA